MGTRSRARRTARQAREAAARGAGGAGASTDGAGGAGASTDGTLAAATSTKRRARVPYVGRPFEGLPGETEWVALRELVPAATAPVRLVGEHTTRQVTVTTMLPGAAAALVRANGEVLLAVQVPPASGDVSRDLAATLERALQAEPGQSLPVAPPPGPGTRLQDLLETGPEAQPLVLSVHDGFDFWLADEVEPTPQVRAALEQANAGLNPTRRLVTVTSAYWTRSGSHTYLRWVLPYDEEPLLDAFARLHAAAADSLGEGTRFLGSFRAHGLLVPVWELSPDMEADDCEQPATDYLARVVDTLADPRPLTQQERGARAGLVNRQLTL